MISVWCANSTSTLRQTKCSQCKARGANACVRVFELRSLSQAQPGLSSHDSAFATVGRCQRRCLYVLRCFEHMHMLSLICCCTDPHVGNTQQNYASRLDCSMAPSRLIGLKSFCQCLSTSQVPEYQDEFVASQESWSNVPTC